MLAHDVAMPAKGLFKMKHPHVSEKHLLIQPPHIWRQIWAQAHDVRLVYLGLNLGCQSDVRKIIIKYERRGALHFIAERLFMIA